MGNYKTGTRLFFKALRLLAILVLPSSAWAVDIITLSIGETPSDHRFAIKVDVLEAALKASEAEYGPYELKINQRPMNRNRSVSILNHGNNINVYFALARRNQEIDAIRIPIPIRKGLVSYRLLIIRKGDEEKFSKIHNIEDLAAIRTGANPSWATYEAITQHHFNVTNVELYDSLFKMLAHGRYDYIIRTVNEVWAEQERFEAPPYNLVIEPSLLLHLPSATNIFVSKDNPRLAERITSGLHTIVDNGVFEALFQKHYAETIKRIEFDKRRIINIENPELPKDIPMNSEKLWFTPKQTKA